MTSKPLVSIIIPIYDVEPYLEECVNSVLTQTYSNMEIILVDDESPDNCPKLCDDFSLKDSRVIVIHKKNGGLSDSRNTGLNIAKGKYVYFLDSDDIIEKNAIELLIMEAEHYSADVILFDSIVFGDTHESNYHNDYYVRKGLYSNPISGIEMLENLLENNEYRSSVPMTFIRKDFLLTSQIMFHKGLIYEDELFTFDVLLAAKIAVHLPETLYHRRLRENSIMTSRVKPKNFTSIVFVVSEMINAHLSSETDEQKQAILSKIKDILPAISNTFHRLSLKSRVQGFHELKSFKKLLKTHNYLLNANIKAQTSRIRFFASPKKTLIKKLPSNVKTVVKKVVQRIRSFKSSTNLALSELQKDIANPRLLLIGTPIHGNLGDHAIAIAEKDLLAEYCPNRQLIDITMPEFILHYQKIKRLVQSDDVLLISGGGWLGNLWLHNEELVRSVITDYPDNKIIILPQTIFFDKTAEGQKEKSISQKIYSKHQNLLFCLRDKNSYDFVIENHFLANNDNCLYTPDVALGLQQSHFNTSREGVLLCFRPDKERRITSEERKSIKEYFWEKEIATTNTTTVYLKSIPLESRVDSVNEKLAEYAKSKLVITDRLHSMIFAAITGTPCIAFDNVTGKVSGVYEWIKHLPYIKCVSSAEEALSYADSLLEMDSGLYQNRIIKETFEKIISSI